ncbi:hypothetical protein DSO57_1012925 [Entomophthora muscae]|uniref:Uncharacterized protein n=1 Tax=Entomophthora muscae TaxID=34485 RepID=A0ACC2U3L1_9FUNG|nr:hypothetical protein DSO57_1012925 [Entomophthora muscae]
MYNLSHPSNVGKHERDRKCDSGQHCNYVHAFITPIFQKEKPQHNYDKPIEKAVEPTSKKDSKEHSKADNNLKEAGKRPRRDKEKPHKLRDLYYKRHSDHDPPSPKRTKDYRDYYKGDRYNSQPRSRDERRSRESSRDFLRERSYEFRRRPVERQRKSYRSRERNEREERNSTRSNRDSPER